jgi:4-amino-4-deoxy-L-arabinose transferase-like glycosyltransferase
VLLPPRSTRNSCILLLLFVVGFLLFLTLPSKKLDRYALPVFPALDLLAGLGYWAVGTRLLRALAARRPGAPRLAAVGLVGLLGIAQALPLLMVAPYPLAYYNPLMGGAPAAARVMLVGWGEGLDQVAAYLNAQPGARRQRIAIYFPLVLNFQGMVTGTVTSIGDPDPVDYVVDYVNASQRSQIPGAIVGQAPELAVRINGIVYARVFRMTPPRAAV